LGTRSASDDGCLAAELIGTAPVEPGRIEEYVLLLYPFANTFKPGHVLTVELSNGEPLADEHNLLLPPDAFHLPVGRPVTHTIYRDAAHHSRPGSAVHHAERPRTFRRAEGIVSRVASTPECPGTAGQVIWRLRAAHSIPCVACSLVSAVAPPQFEQTLT
jgi:hypothetical protein